MVGKIHIIIVAGGSGTRFGSPLPKQFLPLCDGRTVIAHTIDNLRRACPEAALTVVLPPGREELFRTLGDYSDIITVPGGRTRWESVKNGLQTVTDDTGIVMVHDAARPFVTAGIMDRLLDAHAAGARGAVPAVTVTDSLRRLAPDGSSEAVDRSVLRAVQTPQSFEAAMLKTCYCLPYRDSFTDDASVMEAATEASPAMVPGEWFNIKITDPADIATADFIVKELGL